MITDYPKVYNKRYGLIQTVIGEEHEEGHFVIVDHLRYSLTEFLDLFLTLRDVSKEPRPVPVVDEVQTLIL